MKTIFLSFDMKWYLPLYDGRKKYEHRKRFCEEPVRAFIYLGKPIQAIVAEIGLGERENICDWQEKYIDDEIVIQRINDLKKRNNYGMKVLWFKEIVPIELADIQEIFLDFRVPRSYIVLENKKELLKWLDSVKRYTSHSYCNLDKDFTKEIICTY